VRRLPVASAPPPRLLAACRACQSASPPLAGLPQPAVSAPASSARCRCVQSVSGPFPTYPNHMGARAEVERLAAMHPGATLLLVAHGGVLQCLLERAAGRRPPGGAVPNGSLAAVRVDGAVWALLFWPRAVGPGADASARGGGWGGG